MKTAHFNNNLENMAMQITLNSKNTKCITGHYRYSIFSRHFRAAESMARGIHSCPNGFLPFARPAPLYCEE
jgi:hypothetical protein